ncbi:MAG: proteasome assembly chaperone family protein [Candidatus Hadarchaeaceae archaeon]
MKETVIDVLSKPRLSNPVLIGGLPGMGYVGKLAAEHLVAEIKAKKFAELYSPHFPHQAIVDGSGLIRLPRNEFYWARVDGRSLVIWTGDAQSVTPEGHYEIVEKVLDFAEKLGVKRMYTLGGFATGKFSRAQPKVVALGDPDLLRELSPFGVSIEKKGGPIIGAAGLLVGLGKLRQMFGVCLLGETHGMLVDHRAAQAVLEVVLKVLDLNISLQNLQQRARETEQMIERVQREITSREEMMRKHEEEESWYIG